MKYRVVLRRRFKTGLLFEGVLPVLSVAAALVFAGGALSVFGVSPVATYRAMFRGALGSGYGFSEVVVKTIPLVISGIAVALAFRMKTWNIGAEGQIYLGALASAAMVRYFPSGNQAVMLLTMTVGAALAGGAWGYMAGFMKSRWNVNEVITTLMLNYIGLHLADYFIYGSWRDPSSLGFPMTPPFPPSARLPQFFGTRVHLGIVAAVILVLVFRLVIRWTRWGFEIRAIGDNPRAAVYSGIRYGRNVELVLFISGAIAGLAGMTEIAGLQGRLQPGFSPGYGYTAIIVAWLARLNPWAILVVSFFMGVLLVGGETIQVIMRLPLASVQVIQGCILFSVLGFEFFRNYRVFLVRKESG
ncbi:MAG: ABC transporter permease [Thermovirgaceae bacterium]|nr:ABC transporter permease [Synergistales bacterium]HPC75219.1 ABC transporter permease [Synergistales bacterium]